MLIVHPLVCFVGGPVSVLYLTTAAPPTPHKAEASQPVPSGVMAVASPGKDEGSSVAMVAGDGGQQRQGVVKRLRGKIR